MRRARLFPHLASSVVARFIRIYIEYTRLIAASLLHDHRDPAQFGLLLRLDYQFPESHLLTLGDVNALGIGRHGTTATSAPDVILPLRDGNAVVQLRGVDRSEFLKIRLPFVQANREKAVVIGLDRTCADAVAGAVGVFWAKK
jgi:hypothetical protein